MHEAALAAAEALVKRWEGLRLVAYLCPAGVWTIGYGHTGPEVVPGLPWSIDEARAALAADLAKAMAQALLYCPSLADGPAERLAAITDFVYNLGPGRLKASTLRRYINTGLWDKVPGELRKLVWGGGRKLPGLVLRREGEIAVWESASA